MWTSTVLSNVCSVIVRSQVCRVLAVAASCAWIHFLVDWCGWLCFVWGQLCIRFPAFITRAKHRLLCVYELYACLCFYGKHPPPSLSLMASFKSLSVCILIFPPSSHFLHFLCPSFIPSSPSYPSSLSLSVVPWLCKNFSPSPSPLINSLLSQSLLFSPSPLSLFSVALYTFDVVHYLIFTQLCSTSPPHLIFLYRLVLLYPLPLIFSHYVSVIWWFAPSQSSHSFPILILTLFSVASVSFMGTSGRLRWSILSYSLFWCAGIARDRGLKD